MLWSSLNLFVGDCFVVCFNCVNNQGLTIYNGTKAFINASVFHPSQLTEDRMLYFWFSDGVLNPLTVAAHHDGRFIRNITGAELTVRTYWWPVDQQDIILLFTLTRVRHNETGVAQRNLQGEEICDFNPLVDLCFVRYCSCRLWGRFARADSFL